MRIFNSRPTNYHEEYCEIERMKELKKCEKEFEEFCRTEPIILIE